jgi:pimeloyl-ACP methyl ester carboxylesterase
MRITVNGTSLYFDVEGTGLVPDGPIMRAKPTLLLLHGGPGFDHTMFKPDFSALADVAQVIYLDHRANGRSVNTDPNTWTLAQWGDDVKGFCDALGIERPIVYGLSFGGFVAQSYATRHPDHPGKLILASTVAKQDLTPVLAAFESIGGATARDVAERFWTNPTPETRETYLRVCHPLYRTKPADTSAARARRILNNDVMMRFNGPDGDLRTMDFRHALAKIRCPTLVMAGERDPIAPIAFSEEIVASLPSHLVRFERFADCGHGVHWDDPERAFAVIREFILG